MSLSADEIAELVAMGATTEHLLAVAEWADKGRKEGDDLVAMIRELVAAGSEAAILGRLVMFAATASIVAKRAARKAQYNSKCGPRERWGYDGPITPRLPEPEWWALRWRILARDNHICHYCDARDERMCADHVIPLSRGGTNEPDNLVACCLPCNSSKSDKLLTEWEGRST